LPPTRERKRVSSRLEMVRMFRILLCVSLRAKRSNRQLALWGLLGHKQRASQ
jgi:hypothetical protein